MNATHVLPTTYPRTMGPNAMRYLGEVVASGLSSDMVARFEQAFAAEMGVRHCIATPGCTPALATLAAALQFEPGDEIIVSPVSDYGTIQGLVHQHYIPVFADTEPGGINLSAATIRPLITGRTRAILTVHKTGLACDMDPILMLAREQGLVVYEDVCQAIFSEYKNRLAGTLGLAAAFSFDNEKTLGSDTGGCVVTDDDALAERLRFVGQHRGAVHVPGFGRSHAVAGYAHRMPLAVAAITMAQLEICRPQVAQRDRMARLLTQLIGDIPGIVPLAIPDYVTHYSCWMFGFSVEPAAFRCLPAEFAAQVTAAGIPGAGLAEYYLLPAACPFLQEAATRGDYPFSQPPAARSYTYGADACPNARDFLKTFIRWTTFCEKYQEADCEYAAAIIRDVAQRNAV